MLAVLGLLGGLALGPSQDSASDTEPKARTGILPLRTEGILPKHRKAVLGKTLFKGLRLGSFDVIDPAKVADAYPRAGCEDAECLANVAKKLDARYLVQATIVVKQSDLDFRLELIDGDTGQSIAHADQVCEICSDHEAETTARSLGASLGRTLEATTRAEPMLTVQSSPRGARVTIDGEDVGTTPLRVAVPPGPHEIEVSAPSRLPQTRRLELVAGVEEELTVELERAPDEERGIPPWLGWAMITTGMGAAGGGAVLLGIHQRPILRDCTGDNIDVDGDCKFRHNTIVGGATLTAAGVAAIAGGIAVLIVRRRAHPKEQARLRPSLGGITLVF